MPLRNALVINDPGAQACIDTSLLTLPAEWRTTVCTWDDASLERIARTPADVIIAVAVGRLRRAQKFLEELRRRPVHKCLFVVLPFDAGHDALQISLDVADDLVLWPARADELEYRLARLLGRRHADDEAVENALTEEMGLRELVGDDPAFRNVLRQVKGASRSDAPLVITGETGTGKEMCARGVHHLSRRRNLPFIPVDCGAIPPHLFENEIFGHSRGAYTDAQTEQKGLVSMAAGGTLFLDEMDMLPLSVQAKLLRFLQDRTYKPLGSDRFLQADVRVIAATNRDIDRCVREGQFRADLYFRLNVLRLELPPLRKRAGDIELLARHFLLLESAGGGERKILSSGALRKLQDYEWPGNVRELHNVIQRAALSADGPQILSCHIEVQHNVPAEDDCACGYREARAHAIESFERSYVESMIQKHNGNITRAARDAGKERRSFGRLVKKYRS